MAAKKLLVADDSLTIQKVIRLALSGTAGLSGEGYDIQAVSDGNDAVQQISLFRPDVVLIDVSLPGKTAFEVKRSVNEHRDLDSVRFILMSSAFEKVDESQAAEVRFHGRLTKPFDPAHLREVLIEVLSKGSETHREEPTMILGEPTAPPGMPSLPNFEDLPPPPPGENAENDIKNLTESTIRMSGLDDFNWSVQEHSLKPTPAMTDLGGSNFTLPQRELPGGSAGPNTLEFTPPPPPAFSFNNESLPDFPRQSDSEELTPPPPPSFDEEPSSSPQQTASSPMSSSEMEDDIRQEVEKALRKMAQQLLPEVAERVIKQEIHRMLMEKAGP